jgi:hypothetical protein
MGALLRRIAGMFRGAKPPPGRAPSGLTAWTAVEASELFTWFGVHEVGREALSGGGQRLHLKPGGYQESVDLWVDLDAHGGVMTARLELARDWIDAPDTAPFALDIAKSALPILAPRSAVVEEFAARLWQRLGQMRVLMRAGALDEPSAPAPPGIERAVAAYIGEHDRATVADQTVRLTIENREGAGRKLVALALSPPTAPEAPR